MRLRCTNNLSALEPSGGGRVSSKTHFDRQVSASLLILSSALHFSEENIEATTKRFVDSFMISSNFNLLVEVVSAEAGSVEIFLPTK